MFLTNHSSAFLLHDVRVVKNVACLSSLIAAVYPRFSRHLLLGRISCDNLNRIKFLVCLHGEYNILV